MSHHTNEIFIIFNIPETFGSADLRLFFTEFVESEKFICFHYKRRPETKLNNFSKSAVLGEAGVSTKFNCCPVRISSNEAEHFLQRYNQSHWSDENGVDLDFRCFITKGSETEHWIGLEESNPPSVLPRGNVGTCTKFLMDSIRACKLPPSVIKRLKLNFHERRRRAYANVPFKYEKTKIHKSFYVPSTEVQTNRRILKVNVKAKPSKSQNDEFQSGKKKTTLPRVGDSPDSDTEPPVEGGSDEEEEWDRHRSLHADVSARRQLVDPDDIELQEGTKERRYEDKMEVTWEKGGPGLVFYTDERFWREQHHDDSDEADDWDVDMEGYEVEGGGDKDNRDAMDMFRSDELRDGKTSESVFKKKSRDFKIGEFEKHTRGVGRRLMERQGWKDGSGLGSELSGMATPIEACGTSSRTGLGYSGEDLPTIKFNKKWKKPHQCTINDKVKDKPFHISTIYDEQESD